MSHGLTLHPLALGELTNDAGLALAGEGMASVHDPQPMKTLCVQNMAAYVIVHPKVGPILYDAGIATDYETLWPEEVRGLVSPTTYAREHQLAVALRAIGFEVADIKAVILSHLHLDHASGIEVFRGTDVPIYVHEIELKNAFYAVATKEDFGPYLPHYLDARFNWKAISVDTIELFAGITLHRTAGHAEGLLMLQLELAHAGNVILTSDQFPLAQNYEEPRPQGWIMRDHAAWWRSLKYTENLVSRFDARLVYGHDVANFAALAAEGPLD